MPQPRPKAWADMSTGMLRAHELDWQGPLKGNTIVESTVVWISEPAGLVFSNLELVGSRTLVDVSTPDRAPVDYEIRCTLTDSSGLVLETEPPIQLRVNQGGIYTGPFWFGNPLINVAKILELPLTLFAPTVQNAVGADAPLLPLTLTLFAPTVAIVPTPLSIPIALQFQGANAPVLTKTFAAAAADATRSTVSIWLRRNGGRTATRQGMTFLFGGADASNNSAFYLDEGDIFAFGEGVLTFEHRNGGVTAGGLESKFYTRDDGAWYHLVVALDSNEAVATDRIKFWINGRFLTDTIQLSTMAQGATFDWLGTDPNSIGQGATNKHAVHQLDSNIAEMHVVDGQALTANSFGAFGADGMWSPVKFPAAAHGANGFHLDFADSSDFGKDTGTGLNNWSSSGLVAGDQILDVPDNVFPVIVPYIGQGAARILQGGTVMDAVDGGRHNALASVGLTSGEWYWEVEFDDTPDRIMAGLYEHSHGIPEAGPTGTSLNPNVLGGYSIVADGTFYSNRDGGVATGFTFVAGDIAHFAYNADTGQLWVGRNGSWNGFPPFFGNIATVVSAAGGQLAASPWVQVSATSAGVTTGRLIVNFGAKSSKPFAHAIPFGYSAISTGAMPDAAYAPIPNGRVGQDTILYTGTGATQSLSGLLFAPDLGWVKQRSAVVRDHKLVDTVRGNNEHISTNLVAAEVTDAQGLALDAAGFTVGSAVDVNDLNDTYVGWMFKKGPAFGVDIVQYTGNGAAGNTFAHNLGARPDLVMVKNLDQGTDWYMLWMAWLDDVILSGRFVWEPVVNPETYAVPMQGGDREQTPIYWNDTAPTSSVVTLGTSGAVNASGDRHIAYLFRSIPGYLRVSALYRLAPWCGFRPRFILRRRMSFGSGSGNLDIMDRTLLSSADSDTMGLVNYFGARSFNEIRSRSLFGNLNNVEVLDDITLSARDFNGGGSGGNHAFSFLAFAEFATKKSRGY